MPSEPSPCLIHMASAFFPLACRYPLWEPLPGRFPLKKGSYSKPSQWQAQAHRQAQEQARLQAQGQGLLQVWLFQMMMPVMRCVPGGSGMP